MDILLTDDEVRLLKELIGTKPFILVTEASHMLRAMAMLVAMSLSW